MIDREAFPVLSEHDHFLYRRVVPPDHFLRKASLAVPWDGIATQIEAYYSSTEGRPPIAPVAMLKLAYLSFQYNLSDREVIKRANTDLAFRWFIQFPIVGKLPHPTSLCVFRARIGVEGFRDVFDQVVRAAREQGLVKDRLRIKDATHVIANMEVPSTLALVGQTRDGLLAAANPFARELVEGEQVGLALLRDATAKQPIAERLAARVTHLRQVLDWADDLTPPPQADDNRAWQKFLAARKLAHTILNDRENPSSSSGTLSAVDPDARRGKHGQYYEGYMIVSVR